MSREAPGAPQERIVGRDDLPLRVEHHDAVVDAVDHRLEAFLLRADLAHQAGHRIRHRVELARQPRNRVGALRRNAPREVPGGDQAGRGFEALQPPQHGDADHQHDRANQK